MKRHRNSSGEQAPAPIVRITSYLNAVDSSVTAQLTTTTPPTSYIFFLFVICSLFILHCYPSIPPYLFKMKSSMLSSLLLPLAVSARFVMPQELDQVSLTVDTLVEGNAASSPEKFLIELQPGETRWVTEDQKWELRRVSLHTVIDHRKCH
jgi:hypothetical protein